jgi:hypothetical protein
MGAKLFHVDKQTGMTKLIVAFRNFANAPDSSTFFSQCSQNKQLLFLYTALIDWFL